MFVVILAQSAATSRAYAARHDERFDQGTDLAGLAWANLGAALSGTFVVNGSPTKTEMVDSAGGRSQLAQLTTAAMVLLVLLLLTGPLAYMPEALLAAVVFAIGLDLVDYRGMCRIYVERRSEFWVALITAGTVVVIGVEPGIVLAMVLSLLQHVRHGYHPKNAVIVPSDQGGWRARPVATRLQAEPGLLVYRFTHSMYYANAQLLTDQMTSLVTGAQPPLRWICIDASAVDEVDFSALESLRRLRDRLAARSVRLVFAQVMEDVRTESRYDFAELVGRDAFYDSIDAVVRAYRAGRQE
jgi:SulP family sulfate permease